MFWDKCLLLPRVYSTKRYYYVHYGKCLVRKYGEYFFVPFLFSNAVFGFRHSRIFEISWYKTGTFISLFFLEQVNLFSGRNKIN